MGTTLRSITTYDTNYDFEFTNSKEVSSARAVISKKSGSNYNEIAKPSLTFSAKKAKLSTSTFGDLKVKDKFKIEVFCTIDGVESRTDFIITVVNAVTIPSNKELAGTVDSSEEFEFSYVTYY